MSPKNNEIADQVLMLALLDQDKSAMTKRGNFEKDSPADLADFADYSDEIFSTSFVRFVPSQCSLW